MKKYILKDAETVSRSFAIDYAADLNPQQYEVVTKAHGPSLVLAGAGSGKTRVLIYKVAYLIERGVLPEQIMLVTFTNKAAQEMQTRIEVLLKNRPKNTWWGTFHHIGNRTLRMFSQHLDLAHDYSILDDDDATELIKSCVSGLRLDKEYAKFPKARVLNGLFSFARNAKTPLPDVVYARYPYFAEMIDDFKSVYSLYAKRKRDANLLDYDDLLSEWLRLLKDVPQVKEFYARKFPYVLIDEYQDTNRLQFDLLKALYANNPSAHVIAVGDDAQSIYSFRAAEIHNLLDFPKTFDKTEIFKLETNYRSTPQILDLANQIIAHNTNQFPKTLSATKGTGELPVVVKVRNAYEQAMFVAQRAGELCEGGVPLRDMAVLFRAHYQAAELEMELVKRGIPYIIRGGIRFFEQAHIKDILSYLRILQNPHDEISWLRLLGLYKGIGRSYAESILQSVRQTGSDIREVLTPAFCEGLTKRTRAGFSHFQRTMRSLLDTVDTSKHVGEGIEHILHQDYQNYLMLTFENAQDRISDINELANMAYTYNSLKDFLADITLREGYKGESYLAGKETDEDYLVLSTVHQAKGLEWNAVFVIGLSEGQFPHQKAAGSAEEIEEERRLFYVATTRAKELLHLVCPMSRLDYRYGHIITRPSLFVAELPKTCYTVWSTCQEEGEEEQKSYEEY